jgi:hypothetical protein
VPAGGDPHRSGTIAYRLMPMLRGSRSARQAVRREARQRQAAKRTVAVYGEAKPKITRAEYPQRGRSRVPARYDPIGRTGEGQSSKVRRGPSLALAFPLTFCSGAALVPGAHCSHRRAVSWQLSVMRTPVALPPILKRMEQRMPERRRFAQTTSLEEEAKRLRKQAQGTPPGIERERLVRRARQAETTPRMTAWLASRGLQAPKEVQ